MVNLCMVGTGRIAMLHMEALRTIGGVRNRWAVSRRQDKTLEFGTQHGFDQVTTDLDVALADPGVDLVIIASPSQHHAHQTTRSLRAGKHVIVEIPVSLGVEDAEHISRLAAEVGRRVLVCHTFRSLEAIREVRRRVRAGLLHVTHIAGYFAIPRRRNEGIGGHERNWVDNLLWHHGCHFVDAAMWVLGADHIEHVNAMFGRAHAEWGMAMDISVAFRTAGDQLVTHALTYNTNQACSELRFIGDEDVLTFRNGQLIDERNEQLVPLPSSLDLVPQNSQMLRTITAGVQCDYSIESVLAPMRVLHQALHSAQLSSRSAT